MIDLRRLPVIPHEPIAHSVVRDNRAALCVLGGAGLVSALIYIVTFLIPFPLLSLYTVPHQDIGTLTNHRPMAAFTFGGAILALFCLYAGGWWLCRHLPASRGAWILVLGSSLLCSLLLVFVYPIGAADLYDYHFSGHIVIAYGANPFVARPDQFASDPLLAYIGWRSMRSLYGPIWQLLNIGVVWLAGSSLLAGLLVYKFVTVVAWSATVLAIRATLLRLSPSSALAGTMVFAWCPLVLFETAVNSHTDIVMALCMVLCVLALAHDRPVLALVALSCAAMVKYIAILLLPLVAVYLWHTYGRQVGWASRWRLAVQGGLALLVPSLIAYSLFWDGWATFTILGQMKGLWTTSPSALVFYGFVPTLGNSGANRLALIASCGVLLLAYGVVLWRWKGSLTTLVERCTSLLWVYLLLCNPWFQPWYLIWLIALGALLPSAALFWRTWIFALMAHASYLFWSFLAFHLHWNARVFAPQAYETCMIYLPPIAVILWSCLAGRVQRIFCPIPC